MLLLLMLASLVAWASWSLAALVGNKRLAMNMGLPTVTSPFGPRSFIWLLLQHTVVRLLGRLPLSLCRWTKYNEYGWSFDDKFKAHQDLGKIFVYVTPSGNELHVANAEVSDQILFRRKDFVKPIKLLGPMDLFGKSLASVEGADWQRHRKITSPPFSERNSETIWDESVRQAKQMLETWNEKNLAGVNSVASDIRTLGLHVLTCAGLGCRTNFTANWRDCLMAVLENFLLLALTPKAAGYLPFLPRRLTKGKVAVEEFKRYMVEMVEAEKLQGFRRTQGGSNLLSTLVQSSQEAQLDLNSADFAGGFYKKVQETSHPVGGLTDSEIYGNIFMFNLAGFASTANTLAYSIFLLAAFPEWQDWVTEEIDLVFHGHEHLDTLTYERIFPQLQRCLAVMLETLRLYGPVLRIPKCTSDSPQTVKVEDRELTVPPRTYVYCNSVALHTHPDYWGPNSLSWIPGRWLIPFSFDSASAHTDRRAKKVAIIARKEMYTPRRGSYIPWADGPRICPGKKFAQLEFVAVIATLLRTHRVEVVPSAGETPELARNRVHQVVEDSGLKMTLQMRNPQSVRLKWLERK